MSSNQHGALNELYVSYFCLIAYTILQSWQLPLAKPSKSFKAFNYVVIINKCVITR